MTWQQRSGDGVVKYVFLHGTPSDGSVWSEVMARRPAEAGCALLDLPDHGRARDEAQGSTAALEARVAAHVAELGDELVLVGHSYGAYLCGRLAARLPGRIARMVLISGFAGLSAERALGLTYGRPARRWVEALPVGNGRLGAMVFGGIGHERLQLNEDTLWTGGPREWNNPNAPKALAEVRRLVAEGKYVEADRAAHGMQGPYTQSYAPLGNLVLSFEHGGQTRGYRRQLDLQSAIADVRYRIGDTALEPDEGTCPCGRGLSRIGGVGGRVFDVIHSDAGRAVGGTFWSLLLRTGVSGVETFRVVQLEPDRLKIEVTPKGALDETKRTHLTSKIREALGDAVSVTFVETDALERLASGKHRFVVALPAGASGGRGAGSSVGSAPAPRDAGASEPAASERAGEVAGGTKR